MAKKTEFSGRLVFVDPEDETLPYWWPAIVVPEEEMDVFRDTMDSDISQVRPDERLVCYFEDASLYEYHIAVIGYKYFSSVVPASALIPFCPEKEPFLSYSKNIRRFTNDMGVSRALAFWNARVIPSGFKWLLPKDATDSNPATDEIEALLDIAQDAEASPPPVGRGRGRRRGSVLKNKTKSPDQTVAKVKKNGSGRKNVPLPAAEPFLAPDISQSADFIDILSRPRRRLVEMGAKLSFSSVSSNPISTSGRKSISLADEAFLSSSFRPRFSIIGHLLPSNI